MPAAIDKAVHGKNKEALESLKVNQYRMRMLRLCMPG